MPDHNSFNAFKVIKAEVQKQLRQAYWTYIQGIISPKLGNHGNKKFWSFIKHTKEDSSGVAPLIGADGRLQDDHKGKAERLNNQFTSDSVFSQISPLKTSQTAVQTLQDHTPISRPWSQNYISPHTSMPNLELFHRGGGGPETLKRIKAANSGRSK